MVAATGDFTCSRGAGYCLKRSELTGAPPTRQLRSVGALFQADHGRRADAAKNRHSSNCVCRDSDLPFFCPSLFCFFREPLSSSRRPAAVLGALTNGSAAPSSGSPG